MAVLVTGACGWIGRRVCAYLASEGAVVAGADLARQAGPWQSFYQLDITTPIDSLAPTEKVDTVIHCAGYAHQPLETREIVGAFYAVNREGTRHMLDWCRRNNVARFLYVSSIAFYDWSSARQVSVDEGHPVRLLTHYAKSKHEGEQLVVGSGLDWRVVRLATVFGAGDRANFARMSQAIKRRRFFIPGSGGARKSVIPVDVAAVLLAKFALAGEVPHRLINVALPEACTLSEICQAYQEVCGWPKVRRLPMSLARGLALFGDLATRLGGHFPLTSQVLNRLVYSTEVSTAHMQQCFPDWRPDSFKAYLNTCKEYYKSL